MRHLRKFQFVWLIGFFLVGCGGSEKNPQQPIGMGGIQNPSNDDAAAGSGGIGGGTLASEDAPTAAPTLDAGGNDLAANRCPDGTVRCDYQSGECIDLKTSMANCGRCGSVCSGNRAATECVNGSCSVTVCDDGYRDCKNGSWDGCETAIDVNNCSDCSIRCVQGEQCTGKVCKCLGDKPSYCSGTCVDLANDPLNCGICGNVCYWGCATGVCTFPTDIAAGADTTCAVMSDRTLYCWGGHRFDGSNQPKSTVPVKVPHLGNVSQVVLGNSHLCALLADGTVDCWGSNEYGQVGNGSKVGGIVNDPIPVSGLYDVIQLDAGPDHICAVRVNGEVWCWGQNGSGQIGNGSSYDPDVTTEPGTCALCQTTPYKVNIGPAVQVAAGWYHTCALLKDNTVLCWGLNDYGQLGRVTPTKPNDCECSPVPGAVGNIGTGKVVAVKAGLGSSCALFDSGSVACWGVMDLITQNYIYGSQSDLSPYATPKTVAGSAGFQTIDSGYHHVCGILADQTLSCWGCNWAYQLGTGKLPNPGRQTWSYESVPLVVKGLSNVTKTALGYDYSCALLADHSIKCTGNNYYGELGNGQADNMYFPNVIFTDVVSPNAKVPAINTCTDKTDCISFAASHVGQNLQDLYGVATNNCDVSITCLFRSNARNVSQRDNFLAGQTLDSTSGPLHWDDASTNATYKCVLPTEKVTCLY